MEETLGTVGERHLPSRWFYALAHSLNLITALLALWFFGEPTSLLRFAAVAVLALIAFGLWVYWFARAIEVVRERRDPRSSRAVLHALVPIALAAVTIVLCTSYGGLGPRFALSRGALESFVQDVIERPDIDRSDSRWVGLYKVSNAHRTRLGVQFETGRAGFFTRAGLAYFSSTPRSDESFEYRHVVGNWYTWHQSAFSD